MAGATASPPEVRRGGPGGISATLEAQLNRVSKGETHGKRVEIWFQDEARIGQKNLLTRVWAPAGSRPLAPKDQRYASAYIFGAVCPQEGKAAAVIMPVCNTKAMNHHLAEISSQVAEDAHAILVVDGAGWHESDELVIPDNITLLKLPAYSPELNPVERVWHYMRSHWLSNRVFKNLKEILDACVDVWNRFVAQPGLIGSLCHVAWAVQPLPVKAEERDYTYEELCGMQNMLFDPFK